MVQTLPRYHESVEDYVRVGRSSISMTDDKVELEIKFIANYQIIIRKVAEEICISYGYCVAIFTDVFGMRQVAAKFVPKLLKFQQKLYHEEIAE